METAPCYIVKVDETDKPALKVASENADVL